MTKEGTIRSAGVVVTDGVARFHTSGETGAKASFTKVAVPMAGDYKPWTGRFSFIAFPSAVTKKMAAELLLSHIGGSDEVMVTALNAVIASKTPKAPKERKAPKAKAVTVEVPQKTLSDAEAAAKKAETLEKIKSVGRARKAAEQAQKANQAA